jgi:hypothetical protein
VEEGVPIKALACLVVGFSVFATFSVYYSHYDREAQQMTGYETARIAYAGKFDEAVREQGVLRERLAVLTAEADYWRDKSLEAVRRDTGELGGGISKNGS